MWYQPFFNTLVLEQSLMYNRGQKESFDDVRDAGNDTHTDEELPSTDYHIYEGSDISSIESDGDIHVDSLINEISKLMEAPSLTMRRTPHRVVLATCMWHEESFEMEQWIESLKEVQDKLIESARQ